MDHENIINLYEHFEGSRYIYLILEYIGSVSLYDYMQSKPDHCLSDEEACHVYYQLCKALQYIHDSGYVHRDVKLHNILVGSKGQVKLIDFGFSVFAPLNNKLNIFCGTPTYMAPEILKKYFC